MMGWIDLSRRYQRTVLVLLIAAVSIFWVLPVVSAVLTAIKTSNDFASSSIWSLPREFGLWENVLTGWHKARLGRSIGNSILYALVGSLGAILFASLAAFAIVRLAIKGGFTIFLIIFSGTIFPFQIYLVPLYSMFLQSGLYDTRIGLCLVYIALCTPFALFVFINHFRMLPKEVYEAAQIDGCTDFQSYYRIYMPLSTAAIAVVFLFQFTWVWNDLQFGLVLSSRARPVMVGLSGMLGTYGGEGLPIVLAAAFIASIPTAVLFIALQKYFARGLVMSSARDA